MISGMSLSTVLALVIATTIPIGVLFAIYRLDLYASSAFRIVALSFVWGMLAYAGAAALNPVLRVWWNGWLVSTLAVGPLSPIQGIRFVAPVVEEALKALILAYWIRQPRFTYFMDAMVYGFAAGIGFAVVENIAYVSVSADPIGLSLARVISTNLMHGSASGIMGLAVGLFRFQKTPPLRALLLTGGVLIAIGIHLSFNNLVTRVSAPGLLYISAALYGLGAVGLIVLAIRQGTQEEKRWIAEKLGEADRVTEQESWAVQNLQNVRELLRPVDEHFGAHKAHQVEQFLLMQARLGILRKSLEKLPEGRPHENIRIEIADITTRMDAIRREVGTYCMLYVRNLYPPDLASVWIGLDARLAGRSPTPAGGGLWSALGERTAHREQDQ